MVLLESLESIANPWPLGHDGLGIRLGFAQVISSISSPRYTPRTGLLRTSSPVTLSPRSSVGAGYAVGVAARSVGVLGTGPRPGLVPRLDLGKVKRSS